MAPGKNNKINLKSDETCDEVENNLRDCCVSESIKFNEMRKSLDVVTGDDTYPIAKRIEDLEEMSKICGWSSVELFVYS